MEIPIDSLRLYFWCHLTPCQSTHLGVKKLDPMTLRGSKMKLRIHLGKGLYRLITFCQECCQCQDFGGNIKESERPPRVVEDLRHDETLVLSKQTHERHFR